MDQWVLEEVLRRTDLSRESLGLDYAALLTRCEQAKIALSTQDRTEIAFTVAGRPHTLALTRDDLEAALRQHGFDTVLWHIVDNLMHTARQKGVFKEDIHDVLLVGGSSLMPAVQAMLRGYFGDIPLHAHKPFTAVVEGALQVAAGGGLEDSLIHSYGLRHLDADRHEHAYEEIIPAGTHYPTQKPFEITLSVSRRDQREIEFVIGEIDSDAISLIEVTYENGQAVFVAHPDPDAPPVTPLNAGAPPVARLKTDSMPGHERLKAMFTIDDQRHLWLTVIDLKSKKKLLQDVMVSVLH